MSRIPVILQFRLTVVAIKRSGRCAGNPRCSQLSSRHQNRAMRLGILPSIHVW
jgi:hypothetical protein